MTAMPKYHMLVKGGAPYSAQRETVQTALQPDGTRKEVHKVVIPMYRDSAGRTRVDRPIFGGRADDLRSSIVLYEIEDPVSGSRYLVDPQNQVVHRSVLEGTPLPASYTLGPTHPPMARQELPEYVKREKLGVEAIEGVATTHCRYTYTYGPTPSDIVPEYTAISEAWTSQELWLPIVTIMTRANGEMSTVSFKNLVLTEPDPALFQIPSGYPVVDEVAPFQIVSIGHRLRYRGTNNAQPAACFSAAHLCGGARPRGFCAAGSLHVRFWKKRL